MQPPILIILVAVAIALTAGFAIASHFSQAKRLDEVGAKLLKMEQRLDRTSRR